MWEVRQQEFTNYQFVYTSLIYYNIISLVRNLKFLLSGTLGMFQIKKNSSWVIKLT